MKFIKQFSIFFLALLILPCSCYKESLSEINEDPTRLSDVDMSLMLPEILTQAAFNEGATSGRLAGIVMQQFTGLDAQQIQYTNYVLGEDALNNFWRTGMYAGVLRSCQVLIDKAVEEEAPFYTGVAKVIMANEYGILTSIFGDIPFSEALLGIENLKPAYDLQSDVYTGILSMFDAAIGDLSKGDGYVGGDLIFDGDAAKWLATANAMKARYLLQLTKRDNGAAAQALTALGSAIGSLADQPTFKFGSGQTDNWSLAKFGQERPSTLGISAQFADMMSSKSDPRQDKYMYEQDGDWFYYDIGNSNLIWGRNDAPVPLISYVEVKFMEAEALLRTSGSDADVTAALKAGIAASMEQVGIDAADYTTYVDTYGDLTGLSTEEKIQRVIEEAYVSYYGYNFHTTWSNFRKTGYPALTPSPLGANGLNPSGVVPRRALYVGSETQTNSANVEAARARQGGGLLDVHVWAFE
ncbi:MAG: SusD/RagB family nutrient-binding outer membrane lipoprotein [Saprospiraceae bacterium]